MSEVRRQAAAAAPREGDGVGPPTAAGRLQALVRRAARAPSTHNSQPWRFRIGRGRIDVLVDPRRWLQVADRNRRELYLSLGCAIENLLIGAEQAGLRHEVVLFPAGPTDIRRAATGRAGGQRAAERGGPALEVPRPPRLFAAISPRHTRRGRFTGEPVDPDLLECLRSCVVEEGVGLQLVSSPRIRGVVGALVARADRIELADPAYRRELAWWIGRGAFGTPWPLSRLAQALVRRVNLGRAQARRDALLVASAPVVGLLTSDRDDRVSRVRTGQALERIWLLATSLGLALQPMSAPLQLPETRREVAVLFGETGRWAQALFRLGRAPRACSPAPRLRLDEVMAD